MARQRNSVRAQREAEDRWWKRAAVLGTWTDVLVRLIQTLLR